MKQTGTLLIGLALAGSAFTLSAQQGQGRGAGAQHRYGAQKFPPPIAAVLDADSNGVLSAAEMDQAPSQLLKLDRNNDGQLTAELSEPIAADARAGKDGKTDAKLKPIAGLVGVSLDELKQREAQRRHRRMRLLA